MEEQELAVVTSYIMYNDLLEDTIHDGSFFQKIDKVILLARFFIAKYPQDYSWEDESFEEVLEDWVKDNWKEILK